MLGFASNNKGREPMEDKKRVLVIFGGQSSEHEVSRISATSILKNINKEKFEVLMMGITKDGKWLPYNGDIDKIPSGEWEQIAIEGNVKGIGIQSSLLDAMVASSNTVGNLDESGKTQVNGKRIDVVFPVLHG
jgi:D-alanine-D-alanine ligase